MYVSNRFRFLTKIFIMQISWDPAVISSQCRTAAYSELFQCSSLFLWHGTVLWNEWKSLCNTIIFLKNTVKPLIEVHLSRQWNCWSLWCSWSIACQCCSNYIFILELTHGFNGLSNDNCRPETFMFWDFVWLILEVWQHSPYLACEDIVWVLLMNKSSLIVGWWCHMLS